MQMYEQILIEYLVRVVPCTSQYSSTVNSTRVLEWVNGRTLNEKRFEDKNRILYLFTLAKNRGYIYYNIPTAHIIQDENLTSGSENHH